MRVAANTAEARLVVKLAGSTEAASPAAAVKVEVSTARAASGGEAVRVSRPS